MKRPKFRPAMPDIDHLLDVLQARGKPWTIGGVAIALVTCWVLVGLSPHDYLRGLIALIVTVASILVMLRIMRGSLFAYNSREDGTDERPVPSERVRRALAKSRQSPKADFTGEELLWESREHPISLWQWFAAAGVLQVVTILVMTQTLVGGGMLWVAGMIAIGCRLLAWHLHRICVTDKRLLVVSGIFNIEYKTMPLSKLTDQTASFPAISNILAWLRIIKTQYATLIVESAGQDQALSKVFYVPEAHKVNRLIMGMVL